MSFQKIFFAPILTAFALAIGLSAAWADAPNLLTYQGRVLESGVLVNGTRNVTISICSQLTGGPACDSTGTQSVFVNNGLFRTTFTAPTSGTNALTGTGSRYIEVNVGGTVLTPREQLTSSPFAVVAGTVNASGITPGMVRSGVNFAGNIDVNQSGILTSGFYNGITLGGWDALGYGSNLVLGGYRASQWDGISFYASGSEKMRLDTNGYIGIGTTSPAATGGKLSVLGTGPTYSLFVSTASNGSSGNLVVSNSGNVGIGTTNAAIKLIVGDFKVGGDSPISNNVNTVLINNPYPSNSEPNERAYQLTIADTGALDANKGGGVGFLAVYDTFGNVSTIAGIFGRRENVTVSNNSGYLSFLTGNPVGVTEKMRITSRGNLGIGTSVPAARLHVSSASAVATDTLLQVSSGVSVGQEVLVVKGNGNIGIGTTTPQSKLQVIGDYVQIPTISSANPLAADCDNAAEAGRLVVRSDGGAGQRLWVCLGAGGWVGF